MSHSHSTAFLEEAAELLRELEEVVLELEENPTDLDLVQRIFRALHTIKGSGAMFGFDEVSRFTHGLETVFDLVRDGRLPVTPHLINLTLEGRDLIKTMLDGGSETNSDRTRSVVAQLQELTRFDQPSSAEDDLDEAGSGRDAIALSQALNRASATKWHISFRPPPDILSTGMNVLLLFRELRELGDLEVEAIVDTLPALESIDPEGCYLAWDLWLTTSQGIDAIRDVFVFVEDSSELRIEPLGEPKEHRKFESLEPERSGAIDETGPVGAEVEPRQPERKLRRDALLAKNAVAQSSIRVAADRLDALLNYVGELVVVQARLSDLALRSNNPETVLVAEEIERLSAGLRDSAMGMRMVPLRGAFDRFRRLIRDLTRDLGKEIEFTTEGGETELDKTVIDQLNDPLLHLIRNCADHGIEMPEERVAAGKPRVGAIRLSALYSGANVLIRIADDGRGLNTEAIRARAIEKGLIAADARLGPSDLLPLILMPGFSTAERVTDLSGRGVGMDVVRRSVEALRGSIEVASEPGAGTTVTLRLPLTLAIIDGLLVRVGSAHFVVPLANVIECIELTSQDVENMHGKRLVNVRGNLVPYIRLREYFNIASESPPVEQVIIVETRDDRFGFALDEVLGDHQTVIKNLGRIYRDVQVISGATILGDGSIALILDPHRLVLDVLNPLNSKLRAGSQDIAGAQASASLVKL